jgi:TATA-box binding protein (TBP) (component of TFIID and TFIIIB)
MAQPAPLQRRVRLKRGACTARLPLREGRRYPRITNLVVKAQFNRPIFLHHLVLHLPHAEFVPASLPAVKLRLRTCEGRRNTTCLIFNTGQMMLIGAQGYYACCRDVHFFQTLLQGVPQPVLPPGSLQAPAAAAEEGGAPGWLGRVRLEPIGPGLRVRHVRVENVCSSGLLSRHSIDLARLHRTFRDCTQYVPEKFPGLKIQLNELARQAPAAGRALDFALHASPPVYQDAAGPDCASLLSAARVRASALGARPPADAGSSGAGRISVCATVFDSGKCNIYGKRSIEQDRRVFEYLVATLEGFRDEGRPQDVRQLHAYRCRQFLRADPQMAAADMSRGLLPEGLAALDPLAPEEPSEGGGRALEVDAASALVLEEHGEDGEEGSLSDGEAFELVRGLGWRHW